MARIFRDEHDENHYYKLLVYSENDKFFGLLRHLGHLESAYDSSAHYTMKCPMINPLVVPDIIKKEHELPLYFEINI